MERMGKDLGSRLLGVLFALGMRLGRSSGVRFFTKTSYVRGGDSHVDDIRRAKNPVTTGNKHLCAGREMGEGESERHMSPVWHVTNVSRLARDTSQVSQVLHDDEFGRGKRGREKVGRERRRGGEDSHCRARGKDNVALI